ncbi:MAG: DUF637 domain-containing protein [Sterolibacteriaceae bacterium]|nr:DUF637 domain-containing protein [Sterolibacteriaceae bacterium]
MFSDGGQLAGTGRVDLDAALRNGLVAGLTTGIGNAALGGSSADSLAGLSNQSGTLQPVASGSTEWADRLLGIGARSLVSAGIQNAIVGSSFEAALRDALVGDLAALGANRIGGARLDAVSHALSHAALGAISAELTGKDAAAGAIGALASALAAQPVDQALGLTGTSRQAAVTAQAMLSGGLASDALGHDPIAAANAALNEVSNNYLSPKQKFEREQALETCGASPMCVAKVKLAYELLSTQQNVGFGVGFGGGIGLQSYDGIMSILQLLDDLPGAVRAIRALIDDPAVRSQFKTQVINDYSERLARLDEAYQDGGWDGSITSGVEAGRLFVDVLGVAAAVKGTAQLTTTLSSSLGRDAGKLAEAAAQAADAKGLTMVIGRLGDLNDLGAAEISLLDRLPYRGSPQENWLQNASVLREAMRRGLPIRDASPGDVSGAFLNAERNLLKNQGWTFDARTNFWMPPNT